MKEEIEEEKNVSEGDLEGESEGDLEGELEEESEGDLEEDLEKELEEDLEGESEGDLEGDFFKKKDLPENTEFKIIKLKKISTPYGDSTIARLDNGGNIFLSENYKFTKENCKNYNELEDKNTFVIKEEGKLKLIVQID